MVKVSNENYINVQGWMVNDLKLKGNELLVYAIIYGFSQAENQRFTGSLQYLADWTNSTKQGIQKNLKSLIDKGYVNKNDVYLNNVKFCEYYATKLHGVCNKVVQGMQQSCTGGMQQSSPNNINNNLLNNKENNISELDKALLAYEEMRKKIKKPLTDYAKEQVLKKLDKMASTEEEKIEILNQSIMNSWQGIFPLKKDKNTNNIFGDDLAF